MRGGDLTIEGLKTPLDCDAVHLNYAQNGENISDVMNSIATRTERMKEELRGYIDSDGATLVCPKIEARVDHGDGVGSFGLYREEEFRRSEYFRVNPSSARQYLRGIKTIINRLELSEEELIHCMDNPQLKEDWSNHEVLQRINRSYKTGWNTYLKFLFAKHDASCVEGDANQKKDVNIEISSEASHGQTAQGGEYAKALRRLPRVLLDNSIVNRAITNALAKGCTSQQWIDRSEVLDERVTETTITSMSMESGNSYGRYFERSGRGENSQIRFAAPVWELLTKLRS